MQRSKRQNRFSDPFKSQVDAPQERKNDIPQNNIQTPSPSLKDHEPPKPTYTISPEYKVAIKSLIREIVVEILGESGCFTKHPEIIHDLHETLKQDKEEENSQTHDDDDNEQWNCYFTSETFWNKESKTVLKDDRLTIKGILTQDAFECALDGKLNFFLFGNKKGVDMDTSRKISFAVHSLDFREEGNKIDGIVLNLDNVAIIQFKTSDFKRLKNNTLPAFVSATLHLHT